MNGKTPLQKVDFNGKVVLVTGGGSGLGAGIAKRFAEAGAKVAVCARHAPTTTCQEIQSSGGEALPVQADLTDPAQVAAAFASIAAEWGAVDVLVNNAGIYPLANLLDMTPEDWDATLDINLKAVFLCTQAAARGMIAAGKGGAIINIGSTEALSPAPMHSHYCASKAGVLMFTRAAALELGAHNIRVNTVSPGLVNRPTLPTDWPDGYNRYLQRAPLARVGDPEEIADACLFLASDAAAWITGANLVVDGGVLSAPAF